MPAPALAPTSSLLTVREDLVFTEGRLLAAGRDAGPHARTVRALLDEWTDVHAVPLGLWDAQTRAHALVSTADDGLDDFIVRFAGAIRARPNNGAKLWSSYFKSPPHQVAAPVLGEQLETMRSWGKVLAKEPEASIKAMKRELDGLLAAADAALAARADAASANEHFRARGDLAVFLAGTAKKRDGAAAALDTIAAEDETLPREYAARFFRRRTTKLSAEEKKARAEKKLLDKQQREATKAAVALAQAKVKAAIAELKAAQRK